MVAESEQEKMMQLDKEERNLKSCALIDLIHKFLVKIIKNNSMVMTN
jgi:hypothetical protein